MKRKRKTVKTTAKQAHRVHRTREMAKARAAPSDVPASQYRVLLRDALIAPDNVTQHKMAMVAAGTIVELMDMVKLFRDRVSPITRRADEVLVRYGQRGKEALGWLASDTPMKVVRGPAFFVKTSDQTALSAWDRIRYFIARADARETHGHRWWLGPWLVANAAAFDVEVKKAIRERGGLPDKKATDPDIHAAHLYRIITSQELDMSTAKLAVTKKGNKKAAPATAKKGAKPAPAPKKGKTEKPSKVKVLPVISQKNHTAYTREREYDGHVIKRLTKDNPHRAGSTQAKRWGVLKKGMSIGEYVSKGGSRGTLSQWIKGGQAKIVRGGTGSTGDAGE